MMIVVDQVSSIRQFKKSMNKTEVFQNGKVCNGVKTGPFYHTHGGAVQTPTLGFEQCLLMQCGLL